MRGFCGGLPQELGQMLGDGRIARVVQADFHERGAAIALRRGGWFDDRKKTVDQDLANFVARDFAADGSAHQARAAAENSQRMIGGSAVCEQSFLGGAALLPERMKLQRVELR